MTIIALGLLMLTPLQQGDDIWDRLHLDATGRMRAEATVDNVSAANGNEIDDRYRGQFRFRFGATYNLTEDVDVIGRISTASDGNDANNPNWDFGDGDGFNGTDVVMDRFYLDWDANDEFNLMIGKQPHAFAMPPIFGEFLWDEDVSPAGFAATWKPETGDGASFDARVAAYVATEVATADDPKMVGAQGNIYVPLAEVDLQLSTSIYDWKDNGTTAVAGNQGNSTTLEDFFIWDTFVAGAMEGGPLEEMSAYFQFTHNLEESDNGVVVGVQLGSSEWVRDNFNTFLLIYDLDGDSVFSPVAQNSTPVAGTGLNDGDGDGMSGLVFGGTYFWRDNVAIKLWVLTSNASGADEDPIRLRLDFDFRIP
jgi:hypothetical protein